MKINNILFALLFLAIGFTASAQANDALITNVKEAIKAGSAKELTNYLNDGVDLNLEGNQQNYSKAQAEFVLRDFFKTHTPTDFTILHKGSSKSGQPYAIGQYTSGTDNYRVFMKIKAVGDRQLIHEISFSKE